MRLIPTLAVTAGALLLAACASLGGGEAAIAPQPDRRLDQGAFYSGTWHEVVRNPMRLTDGCVVGETRFTLEPGGGIFQRDSCRMGSAQGREKVIAGPVTILDRATGAKFRTDYRLFGFIPIPREYWVLDHGDGWFITATPDLKNLIAYTRAPPERVSRAEVDRLAARARALGYSGPLEFPDHPAP